MAYEVVKEVTQPVHGPDGFSLAYAPGEQFAQDHELPPDVPWRLAVAEAAGKPEEKPAAAKPEPAAEPAKPAAKPASGKGA
ncbi:MAG TPA: hypothetical protein VFQ68_45045 [Streptosporangiaceae bacterium]|nr:hypothetical protein [Streptosporangiaceae bacterium]